jgi:hypothetical protein
VEIKDKPLTRRGLLSTISSVFDPLGLISPFILNGKRILKSLCEAGADWDDPLPEDARCKWERWKADLQNLAMVSIPRCYKSKELGEVTSTELHHFSDASMEGYGQCSYIRLTDREGNSDSALVMAKSRVVPSKTVTAVVSARVGKFLDKELDYCNVEHFYYTDSKVVLGYINNESRRFHIFVANRVQEIRDSTLPVNWRYINMDQNPADYASRGMSVNELQNNSLWWKGPPFLVSGPLPLPKEHPVSPQDPELKKIVLQTKVAIVDSDMMERFEHFSSWFKLKKAIAICMKYIEKLRQRDHGHYTPVTTDDLKLAEGQIMKIAQQQDFSTEIEALKKTGVGVQKVTVSHVSRSSRLFPLDPFLDEISILRVGGRLQRSSMPDDLKHPVLVPQHGHVSRLIIDHYHKRTAHSGRGITLNSIRQAGYWIVKSRVAVTTYIMNCVGCRKLRGAPCCQKMADLPADRLEPAAPFTFSAVDYFGPFLIKEGRSEPKRWGALFTCLTSRAIHLETANSLSTDSFLNAYRRFVSRRGPVKLLRCDRGTNFVGGRNELQSALKEMDQNKIKQELLKDECDWVNFDMNYPYASHMGGVWERMIGSARSVLTALLSQNGRQLDDELLRTLFAESEAIVNSRPITVIDTESADLEPLSPSQLLTLKSQVVKPLPGAFVREDIYCRRRWRRVQSLANQFWARWRSEFLTTLQSRKKWNKPVRNLRPGDVVLLIDEGLARCQWPLGRVTEVFPSKDGYVRKVKLSSKGKIYERPIHKLILLLSQRDETD